MEIKLNIGGKEVVVTTEDAASNYGQPVVHVDGEITDGVLTSYVPDVFAERSVLDRLADDAGVHDGPMTRRKLEELADEMLDVEKPRGADYDRVIDEFNDRGRKIRQAEMDAELAD